MDAILDDIVAKEPLVTPSKMEQVRKLIISILSVIIGEPGSYMFRYVAAAFCNFQRNMACHKRSSMSHI